MTRFVIVCEDYRSEPIRTREQAEVRIGQVEDTTACPLPHRIEEVEIA